MAFLDEINVIDCFDCAVCGQNRVLKFFAACNLNVMFACCLPTKEMEILSSINLWSIEVEFAHDNFASDSLLIVVAFSFAAAAAKASCLSLGPLFISCTTIQK